MKQDSVMKKVQIKSYIKLFEIYMIRTMMRILYLFPIKNNRIVINSYRGQQYSCNPKYISEKLIEQYPGKYEIIWFFSEPEKFAFLKKQHKDCEI